MCGSQDGLSQPTALCRGTMVLSLAPELWECIADFLHCDSLSLASAQLRRRLGRRYMEITWRKAWAADVLALAGNLRTLRLTVPKKECVPKAVDALKHARLLHTLAITLTCNEVGFTGAQMLTVLKDSPALHTLTLNLKGMFVGDTGVQALSTLKEARVLQTLILDLSYNEVGDTGAQALAALKEAPALQTLSLDLRHNKVGDPGARALAALKDVPALRPTLHLESNAVGAIGAQALGMDQLVGSDVGEGKGMKQKRVRFDMRVRERIIPGVQCPQVLRGWGRDALEGERGPSVVRSTSRHCASGCLLEGRRRGWGRGS